MRKINYFLYLFTLVICTIPVKAQIISGSSGSAIEEYAVKELQRYMYQLSGKWLEIIPDSVSCDDPVFIVGYPASNKLIAEFDEKEMIRLPATPGEEQGYILKTIERKGKSCLIIAGQSEIGVLYGVYGLLQDHYHIGFYFSGDVLPDTKQAFTLPVVDEQKIPSMYIRGFLPWTNFPQSATSYSWNDWKFIIDQTAKMRMNFILVHNYNGELGHNEPFHNFEYQEYLSRVWMPTARTGHKWSSPGWDVNQYLFGASGFFDDYDFGSECALHNENLTNEQVFRKGVSLFQKVIAYAHSRGVKIGLGLDINLIMPDYQTTPDDPEVIASRVDQIVTDYPDLDYLFCFQSENVGKDTVFFNTWKKIFDGFYEGVKKRNPRTQLAVSGWGLNPVSVESLPADVICAPIAHYSAEFESGDIYGEREYWGCPWLERDIKSSQYYYPYEIHLSGTMESYGRRAPNMKGFFALTWRLTDAIEPKMEFISKVPWDDGIVSSEQVYREYAVLNYGPDAADEITAIIHENEPFASDFGECEPTRAFLPDSTGKTELAKTEEQLLVIDRLVKSTVSPSARFRLNLLRGRIAAARDHIRLNEDFGHYTWNDLPGTMRSWTENFMNRVTDISTLGNIVSIQNRFVRNNYLAREKEFREQQTVKAPSYVQAKGTEKGAVITWKNEEPDADGFYIYRDGRKIGKVPVTQSAFTDLYHDACRYSVSTLDVEGNESPTSVPYSCFAGDSDRRAPQVNVISPVVSHPEGQPLSMKITLLDNRTEESLSAVFYYRKPGASKWVELPMIRKVKSAFTVDLPGECITEEGLEYYFKASDGSNVSVFPVTVPHMNLSFTTYHTSGSVPLPPRGVSVSANRIQWDKSDGEVFQYRIYRGSFKDFQPGLNNLVTYVPKEANSYTDNPEDFDGRKMSGKRYYRITAVDFYDHESQPSDMVIIDYSNQTYDETI